MKLTSKNPITVNTQFDFYEVVIIDGASNDGLLEIDGHEGIVLGKAYDQAATSWTYAVSVIATGIVWSVAERCLRSTGKRVDRSQVYSGDVVRVEVDPNSGDGSIVQK